ncbi:MAG: hypothetical protein ACOX5A_05325 [Aminivibrio sp.]|nr:hypothetical protein [Synergistaceae bacterium]
MRYVSSIEEVAREEAWKEARIETRKEMSLEIAREMILNGMEFPLISRIVKLPESEIRRLAEKLKN